MVVYVEPPSPDKVQAPPGLPEAEEVYWVGRYVTAVAHGLSDEDAHDRADRDWSVAKRLINFEHSVALKHQPGRHDQKTHDPHKTVTVARTRAGVKSGVYDSLSSSVSRRGVEIAAMNLTHTSSWSAAKAHGYGIVKSEGQYHLVNTKAERDTTPADVLDRKVNKLTPSPTKGGSISGTDAAVKSVRYDEFERAGDKDKFVQDEYKQVAQSLGINPDIQVLDDRQFNAKMEPYVKGVTVEGMPLNPNQIAAAYIPDEHGVYLRQREVRTAAQDADSYRRFQNTVYHELGHAYHTEVWGIHTRSSGPYEARWTDEFAESFGRQMAVTSMVDRMKSDPAYAATRPKSYLKWYKTYDGDSMMKETINDNRPEGAIAVKHLPGKHDQKKHDPTKGAGRPVPSDAVSFTGTLYHNTSLEALPGIQQEGLKPGTGGLGRQADGVYFIRQPVEAGTAREAMLSVDFKDAKLAPTSSTYQQLHGEVKDELLTEARAKPIAERGPIRDKAYGDYAFQEAARRYTQLGYDGYEQGWDVVVITNLDLMKQTTKVKHMPGKHDQRFHTPHKYRTMVGAYLVGHEAEQEARRAALGQIMGKVESAVRAKWPDMEQDDPEMFEAYVNDYLDMMALDRQRFMRYSDKLGLGLEEHDATSFFAKMGEASAARQRAIWKWKDQATAVDASGRKQYMVGLDPELERKANAYSSGSAQAAKDTLFRDYGVRVNNIAGVDDAVLQRDLDRLIGLAQAHPAVNRVVTDDLEEVNFRIRESDSSGKRADAGMDNINVFKERGQTLDDDWGGLYSYEWAHEIGHVADKYEYDWSGWNKGRHVSSYAWINYNEDFAETWNASLSSGPTFDGYREQVPEKMARMDALVAQLSSMEDVD